MRHYTPEQWNAYACGALPEAERAAAEEHLYDCDVCLVLYMQAVEQASGIMPTAADADSLALQVMRSIELQSIPGIIDVDTRNPHRRTSVHLRPIFQYVVAAGITLLLMSAGVFREMSSGLEFLESKSQAGNESSVSAKLMDKTIAFLDHIQLQDHGGMQK